MIRVEGLNKGPGWDDSLIRETQVQNMECVYM